MRAWTSCFRFTLRELLLLCMIVGLVLSSYLNYSPLRYTGRPFDLAIEGEGFIQLLDERTAATVFTRRGTLGTNENGQLVLRANGVEWQISPPICIPDNSAEIVVTPRGLVAAREPKGAKLNAMGQLQLASFPRPEKLQEIAPGILTDTPTSGPALQNTPGNEGFGLIRQGMLRRDVLASRR